MEYDCAGKHQDNRGSAMTDFTMTTDADGVATITLPEYLWNQRTKEYPARVGTGSRAETYSGNRV